MGGLAHLGFKKGHRTASMKKLLVVVLLVITVVFCGAMTCCVAFGLSTGRWLAGIGFLLAAVGGVMAFNRLLGVLYGIDERRDDHGSNDNS